MYIFNANCTYILLNISGLSVWDGLVTDWINNKLYWTDTGNNTLAEQSDLYGNFRRILLNDADEPRGIALDSLNDALYMTDWGASPHTKKMHLDGSGRVTIVTQNLVWPNAVTIDFTKCTGQMLGLVLFPEEIWMGAMLLFYWEEQISTISSIWYSSTWWLSLLDRLVTSLLHTDMKNITITSGFYRSTGMNAYPSQLLTNSGEL